MQQSLKSSNSPDYSFSHHEERLQNVKNMPSHCSLYYSSSGWLNSHNRTRTAWHQTTLHSSGGARDTLIRHYNVSLKRGILAPGTSGVCGHQNIAQLWPSRVCVCLLPFFEALMFTISEKRFISLSVLITLGSIRASVSERPCGLFVINEYHESDDLSVWYQLLHSTFTLL